MCCACAGAGACTKRVLALGQTAQWCARVQPARAPPPPSGCACFPVACVVSRVRACTARHAGVSTAFRLVRAQVAERSRGAHARGGARRRSSRWPYLPTIAAPSCRQAERAWTCAQTAPRDEMADGRALAARASAERRAHDTREPRCVGHRPETVRSSQSHDSRLTLRPTVLGME